MATTVDVNSYLNKADLFEYQGETFFDVPDLPATIEQDDNDKIITVDSGYVGRPDLISFDFYGTPDFWWAIALANNIELMPIGISMGRKLRIPALNKIRELLSKT